MIYPEKLKIGDVIGVTAPSMGITGEKNNKRADNAIKKLEKAGFKVKETASTRMMDKSRSTTGENRAKEFMELWNSDKVKSIICAEGGDFAVEVLDYLDFEELKKNAKWIQGYSDITNLGYVFTLNLDIATIYGPNFKSYGMRNWHKSLENSLKLMKQEEFIQESYEKHEVFTGWDDDDTSKEQDPYEEFNLTEPVKWINLNGEEKIEFSGRCIGGCLDCIKDLIGTKYDKVKDYTKKYKDDGIVWFVESFETSTPGLFRTLWQMKNAGYFENCKGIIFGRPLFMREDFGYSYKTAIKDALQDLQIPIILDSDIGHLAPQIPIVNGAILEVKSENGKGSIKNIFR
jgi:muramoyltetrapeptide carboxypeptidase LdcA involved in peptidoglycan recycling